MNVERARELRSNMSHAEALLWTRLRRRQLGCRYRRQHRLAQYIVDFACVDHRVAVESDGGQHSPRADDPRDRAIEVHGYIVMRFWNLHIFQQLSDVLATIEGHTRDGFDRAAWRVDQRYYSQ